MSFLYGCGCGPGWCDRCCAAWARIHRPHEVTEQKTYHFEIEAVPTSLVRNALSDAEWKRVIDSLRCNNCRMSGGWWSKIDPRYDKPGREDYRCQECKTVYSVHVPHKHPEDHD
jgi:hypothetical protein